MKKIILAVFTVFAFTFSNAQDDSSGATSEGSWLVEINTGSWTTGSTAFSLTSEDGNTAWNIGAEAGYAVIDDLFVKAGLGFGDSGFDGPGSSVFTYKVGAKYYIASQFPVGVDFTGASIKDFDENPSYVGLQGGYAWFVAPNVSIEPTIRYNISMNSDFYDDAFQALIGFSLFL